MFWVFRASELEHSNLKEKGGKSLSIRNKTFPFRNSYSPLWLAIGASTNLVEKVCCRPPPPPKKKKNTHTQKKKNVVNDMHEIGLTLCPWISHLKIKFDLGRYLNELLCFPFVFR